MWVFSSESLCDITECLIWETCISLLTKPQSLLGHLGQITLLALSTSGGCCKDKNEEG